MTRVEAALAECDRLIALCEAGKAGTWRDVGDEPDDDWSDLPVAVLPKALPPAPAMLRIGRDVLTRHTPADERLALMLHLDADEDCVQCSEGDGHLSVVCTECGATWDGMDGYSVWPCQEARPWLDLLAPDPTP